MIEDGKESYLLDEIRKPAMHWKVWADNNELCIELIDDGTHTVIVLEPDGEHTKFKYATRQGNSFEPGMYDLKCPGMVADDINDAI